MKKLKKSCFCKIVVDLKPCSFKLLITIAFISHSTGLDSDAKQNYRPSFMDHFDRIFDAGGRGSDSGPNGSSEEDSGGLFRGAKQEDPFKFKKAGPPDFEFVSTKSSKSYEWSCLKLFP